MLQLEGSFTYISVYCRRINSRIVNSILLNRCSLCCQGGFLAAHLAPKLALSHTLSCIVLFRLNLGNLICYD
jgi:hypothetical protein